MEVIALSELQTLVIGLLMLQVATVLAKRLPFVETINLPTPVIGGVLGAGCVAAVRGIWGIELQFAKALTDLMLLLFFTSVGLSAKLSALRAGGRPLVILCAATVLLIVLQNLGGVIVAVLSGASPFYGLLVGSISFVGGPGTAAAWAKEAQAAGLERAPEVAAAASTLAVVVGALVTGPVTGWLVQRKKLKAPDPPTRVPWRKSDQKKKTADGAGAPAAPDAEAPAAPITIERTMSTFLLLLTSVLIGQTLNDWAREVSLPLPGFLTAMIAGVLITNVADAFKYKLDVEPIERDGEVALKAFLVMFLMSLKLWTLGGALVPLLCNIVVQVALSVAVAILLLFRWLGRDYDAAVTVGGFLGFGLSSMAVGMSSMDKVTERYGPSPKAFLLVTLAGSFFVDLANALIIQLSLKLPFFN